MTFLTALREIGGHDGAMTFREWLNDHLNDDSPVGDLASDVAIDTWLARIRQAVWLHLPPRAATMRSTL